MTRATDSANSALPAQSWEISVSEKVVVGPGGVPTCSNFNDGCFITVARRQSHCPER